jgi:ABC-2 type transport system ATP-binding protein
LARSRPEALRPLGIVFQQSTLDIDLTVRQNLRYFAALHGLTRDQAGHRIAAELERVGLKGRDGDQVRTLNGGHRRRLEIARALLTEPKLLLLDEPTVGLDQPTRRALVDYLHRLARERGLALLWATHLFDEAEPGDGLVILAKGQVRASEAFEDLIAREGGGSLEKAFAKLTGDAPGVAA